MGKSRYLAALSTEQRSQLEHRLSQRQNGRCFICDDEIDFVLHSGQLDVDHIDPLLENGLDAENNFALTHASCNRSKGASSLQVARRLAEFERLQGQAQKSGKRGADLGDVLSSYSGGAAELRLQLEDGRVKYSLPHHGDNTIYSLRMMHDKLSGMNTFVAQFPLEYLHHDDRINPRSIGANIRHLITEFLAKRPQLHVALGWWAPDSERSGEEQSGKLRVFDGQHKAAAQILLGVRELPVRVFVEPDTDVLLQANTNAGGKLRQVAFDTAVMRHLGSTLYGDRVRQYRKMRQLRNDDYSFSELDLVRFFRGEHREMTRYIVDAQRDGITNTSTNKLMEFVEWAGRGGNRPLAYISIERSFFKEFLFSKALDTPIDEGLEQGSNPRHLEREQLVRIMSLVAEVFFVSHWDPEIGGRRLENRIRAGDKIPDGHLRAWRLARVEVMANVVHRVRRVVDNYFAVTLKPVHEGRLLHDRLPDEAWDNIRNFLESLAGLPCWIDRNLSGSVFGPKRNLDYWERVFNTGQSPDGVQVLAQPLDLFQMIRGKP